MGLVEEKMNEDWELLDDREKAIYIHGFTIGLMTGHSESEPLHVDQYMNAQQEMFERLQINTENLSGLTLEMLKELDVFQLYQAVMKRND